MIDFSQNFNPLGPPRGITELIASSSNGTKTYSDPENTEILEAASELLGIPPLNICHGVGATELLFRIPDLFPSIPALILQPTFWEYRESNKILNREIVEISMDKPGFIVDINKIEHHLMREPCVVYICNPNNPTSQLLEFHELETLVTNHPTSHFIIDETYLIFRKDFPKSSAIKLLSKGNVHIVVSLSKIFACPGIRSGLFLSNKSYSNLLRSRLIPYSTSSVTAAVVPWLLKQKSYLDETKEYVELRRNQVFTFMSEQMSGFITCRFPQANFVLCKIEASQKKDVHNYLLDNGIKIRSGKDFRGLNESYIRFAIKSNDEQDILFKQLQQYFS